MKKTVYREVDFPEALFEHIHNSANIQVYAGETHGWTGPVKFETWISPIDKALNQKFRIVTEAEPKFRPYRNFNEVPAGKIATLTIRGEAYRGPLGIYAGEDFMYFSVGAWGGGWTAQLLLEHGKFDDGSLCGVEE